VEITEVRIKLMDEPGERLKAFCSITFDDCFVIRDLKIIEGTNGAFVAMPSRKLTSHCPKCHAKNHLRAAYCNSCGLRLRDDRAIRDAEGRAKLYADIAHPINSSCREMIQRRVIEEYDSEVDRASEPGYVSRYDEMDAYESVEQGSKPSTSVSAGMTQTHIQPAAKEPRPPHTPASPSPSKRPDTADRKSTRDEDDDFGAGIF